MCNPAPMRSSVAYLDPLSLASCLLLITHALSNDNKGRHILATAILAVSFKPRMITAALDGVVRAINSVYSTSQCLAAVSNKKTKAISPDSPLNHINKEVGCDAAVFTAALTYPENVFVALAVNTQGNDDMTVAILNSIDIHGDDVLVVETPLAQLLELLLAFFDKLAAEL